MAVPKKTLYQVLGVPRDASSADIGLGYEMRSAEMARAVPPDPSGVALVRDAYEVLSNPERRAAYDASLVSAAERAAAREQATTDLAVGEDPGARKLPIVPLMVGAAVVLVTIFIVLRPLRDKPPPATAGPAVVAESQQPGTATTTATATPAPEPPPPPPPPRLRVGPEILADATAAGGQLLAYSMSGSMTPIGMALAIAPGMMVTTCHGIPAGANLVVRVGRDQYPADLVVTDEQLDICRLAVAGLTVPPFKPFEELPAEGAKIFVVGMNAKGEMAATEGAVKRVVKTPVGEVLAISVKVAPTASGGGIFDEQGRLIGIATTPHNYGRNLDIGLPAAWIAKSRSRTRQDAAPK